MIPWFTPGSGSSCLSSFKGESRCKHRREFEFFIRIFILQISNHDRVLDLLILDKLRCELSKVNLKAFETVVVRNNRLIIFINGNDLSGENTRTVIVAVVFQSVSVILSFFWRPDEMNPLINLCLPIKLSFVQISRIE